MRLIEMISPKPLRNNSDRPQRGSHSGDGRWAGIERARRVARSSDPAESYWSKWHRSDATSGVNSHGPQLRPSKGGKVYPIKLSKKDIKRRQLKAYTRMFAKESAAAAAVKAASEKRKLRVKKQKNTIRLVKALRKVSESQPLVEMSAGLYRRAMFAAKKKQKEWGERYSAASSHVGGLGVSGKANYGRKLASQANQKYAQKVRQESRFGKKVDAAVKAGIARHNPANNQMKKPATTAPATTPAAQAPTQSPGQKRGLTRLGKVAAAYGVYRAGKWALGKAKNLYNRVRYGSANQQPTQQAA